MAAAPRYGITPWGAWFAEALEGFDESGRLSRGKSYANTGRVVSIEFEGRSAIAKVKGRSRPWYKVRIDFPPLGEAAVNKLFALIEAEPLLLARIEAGELPSELIDRLKASRIELIPRAWSSMKRSCDCPDWGDPCKHMAAVHYLIAQEVDRDPGLLFRLRGVDLAERFKRKPRKVALIPPFAVEFREEPASRVPDSAPSLPRIESYLGFVTSLIPQRPPFAEADFGAALVEFYHRATAESPASNGSGPSLESRFSGASFEIETEGTPNGEPSSPAIGSPMIVAVAESGGLTRRLKAADLLALFLGFEDERGTPGYRFLFHLSRLILAAWRSSAFVPAPILDGEGRTLRVVWTLLPAAKELGDALDELGRYDPGLLRGGRHGKRGGTIAGRSTARLIAASALGDWVRRLGFRPSGERLSVRDLVDLFFSGATLDASGPGARLLPQAIASWLSIFNLDFGASAYRYRFDVAEAPNGGNASSSAAEPRFTLGLSVLPADAAGVKARGVALKDAAKRLGDFETLRVPTALSAYVPEIRLLASEKNILLEESRLAAFLGEASSVLRRLGIEIVLPKALKRALTPRLVLDVKASGSGSLKSYLDLESVLSYDWRIAVGDQLLSPAAFEKLVRGKKEIVLFHDGFLRLDPAEVARLLERSRSKCRPSALDLVAARLAGDAVFSADAEELAASLFAEREETPPAGLMASLRPYQERGYRWAMSNLRAGFGCVLADDMGLGKTVQAIAVMLRLAEEGLVDEGMLVVAPAALLTNWERELERFAPELAVTRYHGQRRRLAEGPVVHLTTYETAARDADKLEARNFSLLVYDEAQLMKNAQTRRSRGVKSIRSVYKLALSGTPVENRLEDLRSVFDAVLPGYLGGPSEFKKLWRERIEIDRDLETADKLKRITSPFLMRRLKTDRDIVPDLPDKIVSDEYAKLVPEQAALYESVVRRGLDEAGDAAPGPERAALVLKLLTSLKQICDHPRVYDKESPPEASRSGKCLLLVELLGEMLGRREKVLVFSQYVEALELLATVVRDELSEDCLVYHGGLSKRSRDAAVDRFQGESASRVMLVSLRAGGLGLNLTAASRVVHYDLWFNPAVENQATDRAFRIGQTKNVFVHRFITAGSFEERIDAMLRDKRELVDLTLASGESWITKMSDDQLRRLFER